MSLRVLIPPPTSLENYSYCRYLTRGPWFPEKFKAYNIVKAIKGSPFNGYSDLTVGAGWKRLTSERTEVAFEWFAEQVASQTRFARDTQYCLCPIPDSECSSDCGRTPKTIKLAEILNQRLPRLEILDVLRFAKQMPKSSQTNERDEEALFANMICTIKKVPDAHIILLDDVCTTGSHAKAAARRLMKHGADHLSAMSVARTTLDEDDKLFGLRIDKL